jgi:hypothetical protein
MVLGRADGKGSKALKIKVLNFFAAHMALVLLITPCRCSCNVPKPTTNQ